MPRNVIEGKFKDRRRKHSHWLVTVTYGNKETFGRVYTDKLSDLRHVRKSHLW